MSLCNIRHMYAVYEFSFSQITHNFDQSFFRPEFLEPINSLMIVSILTFQYLPGFWSDTLTAVILKLFSDLLYSKKFSISLVYLLVLISTSCSRLS